MNIRQAKTSTLHMGLAVAFDSIHLMQTMGHVQPALGPI